MHGNEPFDFEIGIKSDPIEYRYSFEWLLELMNRHGIRYLQFGSFFEMYSLPDSWFSELRELARSYDVEIKSCFTAHRELGGFFAADSRFTNVARAGFERLIEVAALLGAEFAGSNPGAIYRDRPDDKAIGVETYLRHLEELMAVARRHGLRALTIEPMSSHFEPPSYPEETEGFMKRLADFHQAHKDTTVPAYLCADVSHGLVAADGVVVHSSRELFSREIPWIAEYHIKNTDASYGATFGFGDDERARGTIHLPDFLRMIQENADRFPLGPPIGYLELPGPKLGRDYSDPLLESMISSSIAYIRETVSAVC